MPPLDSLTTSIITTVSHLSHFSLDLSSAGAYTSFQYPADTSGVLDGMALIFFLLHISGKIKKSKVCRAAFPQHVELMNRGSIPSLHLSILSSTTCAAPILGARTGLVTPNNILLMHGYRGHLSGSGFEPVKPVSGFSFTWAYVADLGGIFTASFVPLIIGSKFQNLGFNWTFERFSPPILHLKLLLRIAHIDLLGHSNTTVLDHIELSLQRHLSHVCT